MLSIVNLLLLSKFCSNVLLVVAAVYISYDGELLIAPFAPCQEAARPRQTHPTRDSFPFKLHVSHTLQVSRDEFDKQMLSFNDEVELSTHRIIFGATEPPDARRRYEAEYGSCRYTPEALQIVASFSPLIELEAGRGHWQRALSSAGATVVSFDKWAPSSRDSVPPDMVPVGKVLPGDERSIRTHRDKTLLLVYPPPGDAALRCLDEYRGDVLVYVGEGRGGANSCDEFFDRLDAEFDVASVVELDPFHQCFERLFVLVRKLVPAPGDTAKRTREEPAGGAGV